MTLNFEPNKGQAELCRRLKNWWKFKDKPMFVLSGGPGTGKTTTLKYVIDQLGLSLHEVIGIAFSGKAVNVIASNGLPAETIHAFAYTPKMVRLKDEMGEYILDNHDNYKYSLEFVLKESIPDNIKLIIIDEISMVPDYMIKDLLSFGIPIIGVGDKDQLPPVFGTCSYILRPDYVLTEIMRQKADDPIVYFSRAVNNYQHLQYGTYGSSRILRSIDLGDNLVTDYDMIICCKNSTRDRINNLIRKEIYKRSDYPEVGDKLICRQNVKDRTDGKHFLTNGTIGFIDELLSNNRSSKKITIDFTPDYDDRSLFPNVEMDAKYIKLDYKDRTSFGMSRYVKFEYGNLITVHLSQGSQYDRLLYIDEPFGDREMRRALKYTAISRAAKSIDIVTITP